MGKNRVVLAGALVASLVLASRSARAADWYVDASAASGGSGSQSSPFQTIGAAVAAMSQGDTVWIASGTYGEIVNIAKLPGSGGTTTLRAMPNATPIIDGTNGSSSAGFVVQSSVANTTFEGLTIQNAMNALGVQFYYADGGQVVDCVTKNIDQNAVNFYYSSQGVVRGSTLQGNIGGRKTTGTIIENNEVYGASAEGIGLYDGSTECTVAHNIIHDNYSVDLYLDSVSHSTYDGNLIYESSPSNNLEGIEISDEMYSDLSEPVNSYNTITNNVIYGSNLGIVFWMSGEWPAAQQMLSGLRYDVISNNTIVNTNGALKWDASPAHVGTTIENNIFVAAAGTAPSYLLQANSAGGITLDHDLWFAPDLSQPFLWVNDQVDHAGWVSASSQGASDVLSDPLFAVGSTWSAPPATNLELTKGSPAVGVGVTLSTVPDDYLGAPRPSGKYDMGAFQYGAVVPADGGTVGPTSDGGSTGDASTSDGAAQDTGAPSPAEDASSSGADAGGAHGPSSASGCSCDVVGRSDEVAWSASSVALAFGLAFARRRRPRAYLGR